MLIFLNFYLSIGDDKKILDTFPFRNTIKSYLEKIFGTIDETFDYAIVLLKIKIKILIFFQYRPTNS